MVSYRDLDRMEGFQNTIMEHDLAHAVSFWWRG